LHEQRIFFRDATCADDAIDRYAIFANAFDDRAGSERGRFDQCAVNLGAGRVQGRASDKTGEALVHEDGAIAIVPIQREQPALSGREISSFLREFGVERGFALADSFDPPFENITNGRWSL
jgi:hypothetical protein